MGVVCRYIPRGLAMGGEEFCQDGVECLRVFEGRGVMGIRDDDEPSSGHEPYVGFFDSHG